MFTKKPHQKALQHFVEEWTLSEASWLALQMNQSNFKDSFENYKLEAHITKKGKPEVSQISWGLNQSHLNIETLLHSKRHISGKLDFKDNNELTAMFNVEIEGFIHAFFQRARDLLVQSGKKPATLDGINPQEDKGKEWLRVSLEVLKNALKEVSTNRSDNGPEVSQGLFFCGNHPSTNKFTFRLRIFNLDLELQEDETKSLRVTVYNKKNQESFDNLEPVLQMVFNREKQDVIEYLINILPPVALTITPKKG